MNKLLVSLAAVALMGAGCAKPAVDTTATSSEDVAVHKNAEAGYSVEYPSGFTVFKSVDLQDVEGQGTYKGDAISFPEEMTDRSIFDPQIEIATDRGACNVQGEKVTVGGKEFVKTVVSSGAAGNTYVAESYFITQGSTCFRLNFFTNRANPENYASSQGQAQEFKAAQEKSLAEMRSVFEDVVASLTFLK